MRKVFLCVGLSLAMCLCETFVKAQENNNTFEMTDSRLKKLVQKFKEAVKTDDPKVIAEYVSYPYARPNPISDIDNKEEFIKQYHMLMDEELRKEIDDSSMEDWDSVGWRGIMFNNGLLWLNNDGKLIAINKETQGDKDYIAEWRQKDREALYPPLRNYDVNLYLFETSQWKGRIDSMSKEGGDYRLSLWAKTEEMSEKPEIIIKRGKVDYSEETDSNDYRFTKEGYTYLFSQKNDNTKQMNLSYQLKLYHNDEEILSEQAKIIK